MPKISVLMPIYNTKEKHLRRAVESILNQTFEDFELIIIDDSTIDNTNIIQSYDDKRIKYYKNKTKTGVAASLNYGFKIAQGDYIARMDSDDISLPQRLEKQLSFMENNPEIDILGTYMKYIPSNRLIEYPVENNEIEKAFLFLYCAISHPTIMIKKDTITKFDLKYNEKYTYAEDYELWLSLIGKVKFANLAEVLLYYRKHPYQASKRSLKLQAQITNNLMLKAQNKILNINTTKELEIWEKSLCNKITLEEIKFLINKMEEKINSFNIKESDFKYIKNLYKKIINISPKTPKFIWEIWTNPIKKRLKTGFLFKIKALLSR
jgi:glycosyltransferase involved in cell wall biosynthesis